MIPAGRLAAALSVAIAVAATVASGAFAPVRAQVSGAACPDSADLSVLIAPMAPSTGAPLRVMAVADKASGGDLSLIAPDGRVVATSQGVRGGPPYFWYAEVASPVAGTWHARLERDRAPGGCGTVTRDIVVQGSRPAPIHATSGSLWPLHRSWNRASENLFSAWIEKLFDAPVNVELSWPALDRVLHDRSRNMLFDYLGLNEDQISTPVRPDCADMPYFLRAYFAFKMGLPFGYSKCSRGGGGRPPKCYAWFSVVSAAAGSKLGLAATFGHYLHVVGDAVQSGNGRTLDRDDNTDFYPVALTQETLRPGTIYADPYGHILMLVRRVPQRGGTAGVYLAVDAEPDGSVTRKRFWRGNFLFAHNPALGGPGFKRFRPIVREKNGTLRRLTNREIAADPQYGDFSLEQSQLGVEAFYDKMDEVMSPAPLDPQSAMQAAIEALDEQVKTRVTAVENGRKYQNSARGQVSMPNGPSIFETTGPWEDFSTPARDFRLLIAIDVVRGYPERVVRHPGRYAMPFGQSPASVKAQLQQRLASELASRKFTYTRSDGSSWTLSLKDVVDRADELEMAYNPNDCVELRWGAPPKSAEAATCKRHAPGDQRAKMTKYRSWFQERHWPAGA